MDRFFGFIDSFINERTVRILDCLEFPPKTTVTELDCEIRRDRVGYPKKTVTLFESARVALKLSAWIAFMSDHREFCMTKRAWTRLLGLEVQYIYLHHYLAEREDVLDSELVFPPPGYQQWSEKSSWQDMEPALSQINKLPSPFGTITSMICSFMTTPSDVIYQRDEE